MRQRGAGAVLPAPAGTLVRRIAKGTLIPRNGGPQWSYEPDVPGPRNVDALRAQTTADSGEPGGARVRFRRTSRAEAGGAPGRCVPLRFPPSGREPGRKGHVWWVTRAAVCQFAEEGVRVLEVLDLDERQVLADLRDAHPVHLDAFAGRFEALVRAGEIASVAPVERHDVRRGEDDLLDLPEEAARGRRCGRRGTGCRSAPPPGGRRSCRRSARCCCPVRLCRRPWPTRPR